MGQALRGVFKHCSNPDVSSAFQEGVPLCRRSRTLSTYSPDRHDGSCSSPTDHHVARHARLRRLRTLVYSPAHQRDLSVRLTACSGSIARQSSYKPWTERFAKSAEAATSP